MSSGHNWSDVKKYTLGEIGLFLAACKRKNSQQQADLLKIVWIARNLQTKQAFDKFMHSFDQLNKVQSEDDQHDVAKSWDALAKKLSKLK